MGKFNDEWEERFKNRRSGKINTWSNFLIKLLLLIFVIMLIRFFGASDTKKFRDFIHFSNKNQTEVGE